MPYDAHVAGELFKMMTGVSMVHVLYRGEAPALTDLLGGQAQVMFGSMQASIQYIRAGGHSDRGRIRAGFRGERLVRHRRAQEDAHRNSREAQQGDQCGPCRSKLKARLADLGAEPMSRLCAAARHVQS
jgi:hypothetical protein